MQTRSLGICYVLYGFDLSYFPRLHAQNSVGEVIESVEVRSSKIVASLRNLITMLDIFADRKAMLLSESLAHVV